MSRSPLRPSNPLPSPTGNADRDGRLDTAEKPLLLVDIDGVISVFGFGQGSHPAGGFHAIDGIPHFISAEAGRHLHSLLSSFEAAWCSGWEEKANEYLPHLLGLPGPLPYLSFDRSPGRANAHWKLAAIEAFAGARPLAWVDDAFNDACHAWAQRRVQPTLLVATDPARGLTDDHVARLRGWALEVGSPSALRSGSSTPNIGLSRPSIGPSPEGSRIPSSNHR